jgi:hypothetical protein
MNLKQVPIEDHLDADKVMEWLRFPLSLANSVVQIDLSPDDIEALKEGKFLATDVDGTRVLLRIGGRFEGVSTLVKTGYIDA